MVKMRENCNSIAELCQLRRSGTGLRSFVIHHRFLAHALRSDDITKSRRWKMRRRIIPPFHQCHKRKHRPKIHLLEYLKRNTSFPLLFLPHQTESHALLWLATMKRGGGRGKVNVVNVALWASSFRNAAIKMLHSDKTCPASIVAAQLLLHSARLNGYAICFLHSIEAWQFENSSPRALLFLWMNLFSLWLRHCVASLPP